MGKSLLKGNYKAREVKAEKKEEQSDFEREATKQLGGSTAYVRKAKLIE